MMTGQHDAPLVSVVMPCLNEEEALPSCIKKIQKTFVEHNIAGEIVVSDNGSTDRSVEIAEGLGVRVIHQPIRGYGSAYIKGFATARGRYLVMGDADDTYDFSLIPVFLEKLEKEGYEFVTGSRYLARGESAIPWLHRHLGNPALTGLLNILFNTQYTDVYCGFRAFTREAYDCIQPVSPGMEYNLELAINAHLAKLKIAEIPIVLGKRKGESKLNTLFDGWRSLRMMLLYAPNKVFLLPGFSLLSLGMIIHLLSILRLLHYHGRALGTVTGIAGTICAVLGFEILNLGLHAKTYSWSRRFDKENPLLRNFYALYKLESGLLLGSIIALVGITIALVLLTQWLTSNLAPLAFPEWAPFAATLIVIGLSTIFSSIFVSAMAMSKVAPVERILD